ncbi:MAG: preprotein translocase subunit SecA [Candidatus Zambryskibacteria bacterium CG10_big_fil_rev_8_21_14_0_10_42_12]|uniref:Protein translocase subunit SecA n=1 Tax=Candidatus Zambryskibacteria bacterium CG10_big_fil_rev_8_21_14_0_10_42_12 TaxID=1975115 RepID=A0A2H0QVA3_9BACT|nr:MAG: preprotein translocase subunit SecA [Candidatus Zambryskibacteria bacterium CG10_big_fil_rev_8_21_14_0_10_42_12]
MGFLTNIFKGSGLKRHFNIVTEINKLEPVFEAFSDEQIKQKTQELKQAIQDGKTPDEMLPQAFALVREASKRTLGLRHFDVQLVGGIVLHERGIAEMKTGEGKTLVATLPAYLNALSGKGVHIVTVNDYLSRRDAVWMGQIYDALGLTVSVINHMESFMYDPTHVEKDEERDEEGSYKVVHEFLRPVSRGDAYKADITYGTNQEFGFDYLRDNLEYNPEHIRQKYHHYAIVDEVDSILIDEARTPLIISAPTRRSEDLYVQFAEIASKLKEGEHYEVDEKHRAIKLSDSGISAAEKALNMENIYSEGGIKYVHHLETAVKAQALYKNDREYVVRDGEVVIVDTFTGRLQPGRRWSEGLHQAIEAKEGVAVKEESRTYASITYQNYFRMYDKLAGMTGTALTSKEEFFKVYKLDTIEIPTNKPITRIDNDDFIFQTEQGKWKAIAREVKERNKKGQPVLIGTVSIEKNELLADFLKKEGVKHEVLNAKNHEREGEIVALAGKQGAVTIATNMAGRGVDIKLGGPQATAEEANAVKELGGLFVLGTERHEARRIDNQLRGRSGRQGDPGETQFFVSLEDSLMRIFAGDRVKAMMGRFNIPEDEPIRNKLITRSLESAQQKIEGFNFDARKHVLQFDDILNHQRRIVYGRRRTMLEGSDEDVTTYIDGLFVNETEENKQALAKHKEELGERFVDVARRAILETNDLFWVDHLEMMDYLRSSVNLRAYGGRDPLVEYKKEGLRLFKAMEESIEDQLRTVLPKVGAGILAREETEMAEARKQAERILAESQGSSISEPKVGRNEKVMVERNGEKKEIKFKKLDEHIRDGWVRID